MITMTNKFSPISLFLEDYNKLALPGQKFTADEIQRILKSKGLPVTEEAFNNLRAEIRGRKAIGTATIMGASWLFMNDRLHGNGHFDKERQRVRRQLNWQPRSYKGWDGKWYSYDGLGPMADFLALTADIMDNFDSVADNDLETTLNKMGFLLAANLTNKSMLAGLEPMNDVLTGNPAAMSRWAANFASSLVPLVRSLPHNCVRLTKSSSSCCVTVTSTWMLWILRVRFPMLTTGLMENLSALLRTSLLGVGMLSCR
jgi:hypothetical protein